MGFDADLGFYGFSWDLTIKRIVQKCGRPPKRDGHSDIACWWKSFDCCTDKAMTWRVSSSSNNTDTACAAQGLWAQERRNHESAPLCFRVIWFSSNHRAWCDGIFQIGAFSSNVLTIFFKVSDIGRHPDIQAPKTDQHGTARRTWNCAAEVGRNKRPLRRGLGFQESSKTGGENLP